MTPIIVKGNTQVIALSTTPSSTAITATGASHLLVQTDAASGGGSVRIKTGASGVAVTIGTNATSGVVVHGGLFGVIVEKNALHTHIAAVASAGTPNLFITPVQV